MLTNKIIGTIATATLVTTSFVFAQSGAPDMPPPGPGVEARGEMYTNVETENQVPRPGGLFQRFFGNKEERKEIRHEFHVDMKDAKEDLKQGIMEKRDYMMGSTTPGSATPTPWKDFRKEIRDARGEFRDEISDFRGDIRAKVASLTETQVAAIAVKLGITVETLKAQIASGTPLRDIVKDKMTREELDAIIPRPATGTMATETMMRMEKREERREERRGFFNSLRERFFGGGTSASANVETGAQMNADGTMMDASVNTTANAQIVTPESIRNFFKRIFGF